MPRVLVWLGRTGGKSKVIFGEERLFCEYLPEVLQHYGAAAVKGHKHVLQARSCASHTPHSRWRPARTRTAGLCRSGTLLDRARAARRKRAPAVVPHLLPPRARSHPALLPPPSTHGPRRPPSRQALPRLLTLYCEHGSDMLARGSTRSNKESRAATEVRPTHMYT